MQIDAACHCGAVHLLVTRTPETVTECTCSICRRYGVRWAYYTKDEVAFPAENLATDTYQWGDHLLAFHRCPWCGCVTHWAALDPANPRMAVNARLMPPAITASARIRVYDGGDTERFLNE